jgi:hypothetical protein
MSCGFAAVAVLLLAADDAKTMDAAAALDRVVREAFQAEWTVVAVAREHSLKKGQTQPSPGDVLKFEGVELPNAIPP